MDTMTVTGWIAWGVSAWLLSFVLLLLAKNTLLLPKDYRKFHPELYSTRKLINTISAVTDGKLRRLGPHHWYQLFHAAEHREEEYLRLAKYYYKYDDSKNAAKYEDLYHSISMYRKAMGNMLTRYGL